MSTQGNRSETGRVKWAPAGLRNEGGRDQIGGWGEGQMEGRKYELVAEPRDSMYFI